ncbi:DNA adenine methylase [Mariprofundus micogutta]|uniref:DNA adenine methylase n=1 Tax=Mariprofundus micogutta TaxID=1921010 RepID=A0A1L8CJR7_9PROT|nr:DNA adenine methylase [Mariprofundus micogutta]GAV19109.1 DNA adenine methylase [Mariprofundus micogutta]
MSNDATSLVRQKKRLSRMAERGLQRSTVLVHEKNKESLDILRPHFADPNCADTLVDLAKTASKKTKTVNVAQVKHLSPFRYPGGKTWLVPEVRRWMSSLNYRPTHFVEPFAGGAITGLTIAAEGLADRVVLCEMDADVAAVWHVVFGNSDADADWLFNQIESARLTETFVRSIIESNPRAMRKRAFRTILKNRCQRGGILAPGAGLVKAGENGKGLLSRWYPETLVKRMSLLRSIRERITFIEGDAFDVINEYAANDHAAFLIDPPYSLGGKKAGSRLYTHNAIDHEMLFLEISQVNGQFLMTYDDAREVVDMAARHNLVVAKVPMKNTHHAIMYELLIKKPTQD